MTVFLRPQPAATPVSYQKAMEKSGMLVQPANYLAIYTCKGAPNQGPPGPPGPPYLFDTIIASGSDEYAPLQVDLGAPVASWRAPFPLVVSYVRISLTTAPTGAKIICDLKMNGTTLFSTLLSIDIGDKTSVGASVPAILSTTIIPDDAEFTLWINQVGSTIAGSGLKCSVTGEKTV